MQSRKSQNSHRTAHSIISEGEMMNIDENELYDDN